MNNNLEEIRKSYQAVFKVLNKHKENISFDLNDLKHKSEVHILKIRLNELGFKVNYIGNLTYVDIRDWFHYVHYTPDSQYTISWSDDGRQPSNEELIKVSFPTGAYIFGDSYPTSVFNRLFIELKSFNPLYSDTKNSSLYFSLEDGARLYKEFDEIYKKYRELHTEESKAQKIKELEYQLAKLK